MAFDVYIGTMTRFYRREWENVAQRAARDQGYQYKMIYAGGEPAPPPPADEIHQAVDAWCQGVSRALEPHGCSTVSWDEGDHMPYFTDRPGWDGYSALLVWAAHAEHPDLPLPVAAPEGWADDPAFQRSIDPGFRSRYLTILQGALWLPAEFAFVFQGPTLDSEKSWVGSVIELRRELDDLAHMSGEHLRDLKSSSIGVKPKEEREVSWIRRMFSSSTRASEPERPGPAEAQGERPSFAEAAEVGLSVFRELASKACDHRLPMLLHF